MRQSSFKDITPLLPESLPTISPFLLVRILDQRLIREQQKGDIRANYSSLRGLLIQEHHLSVNTHFKATKQLHKGPQLLATKPQGQERFCWT